MNGIVLINKKALSCLLMVCLCNLLWVSAYARAEIIGMEAIMEPVADNPSDREKVRAFFNRRDILPKLEAYGVSREEALARVDSLTHEEVATLVRKIDQMPEGGYNGDDTLIGLLVVLGVVILIALIVVAVVGIIAIFKTRKNKTAQQENFKDSKYAKELKSDPLASESN